MVVLCVVLVSYVLEIPLMLSHSQGFLDNKGCTCILCFLITGGERPLLIFKLQY